MSLINCYDSPSTLFPLGSGCNISESLYNTWYCFDRKIVNVEESELSCSYAQKTGNFMILTHEESSFQKVLKTLKIMRESDQFYGWADDFHQRLAFKTDYQPSLEMKEDTSYKHWLFNTYRNTLLPPSRYAERVSARGFASFSSGFLKSVPQTFFTVKMPIFRPLLKI